MTKLTEDCGRHSLSRGSGVRPRWALTTKRKVPRSSKVAPNMTTARTLILYRASKSPQRVLGQLDWLGYDNGPLFLIVDGESRTAIAASAACFEILSHPPATKTVSSPVGVTTLERLLAQAHNNVALVIGGAGLENVARQLAASAVRFDAGEAAILTADNDSWAGALSRARAWNWVGTITPEEAR